MGHQTARLGLTLSPLSTAMPPAVECDQLHAGLSVPDFQAALDFYTQKLGFQLAFTWGDPPDFAGLNFGSVQLFLSTGKPTPSNDTPAAWFLLDDVDALHAFHQANRLEIVRPLGNRPWQLRDYTVRDLNGYLLVFGQHLCDSGPPLPIERVDLPVRLEKRLAALLHDLAAHKGMTVNSCLEEMLLHTSEGVGPHTPATLRHIQSLKQKHGIDYDVHASYRFTE